MVAEGTLSAIIDWELAAYHPRFWLATKSSYGGAFSLECETDDPKLWGQLLGQALEDRGFNRQVQAFIQWNSGLEECPKCYFEFGGS